MLSKIFKDPEMVASSIDLPSLFPSIGVPVTDPCLLIQQMSTHGFLWTCQIIHRLNIFGRRNPISTLYALPVQGLTIPEDAISGQTQVISKGEVIRDYVLDFSQASQVEFQTTAAALTVSTNGIINGTRTVLLLRIKGNDTAYPATEDDLYAVAFGDVGSMRAQYNACSYGALLFTPFVGYLNTTYSPRGVLSMDVNVSLINATSTQINAFVQTAGAAMFGSNWLKAVNHTMEFMPKGSDSRFSGQKPGKLTWISFPVRNTTTALMHEIGHNLNLAHSSQGTKEYGDSSDVMALSYWPGVYKICFNGAKDVELGWYPKGTTSLTIPNTTNSRVSRIFDMVGISEYGIKRLNETVVVQIVIDGLNDHFVAFNRANGINAQTGGFKNEVLVTKWVTGAFKNSYR